MNADEPLAPSGGLPPAAAWPARHRIGSFELQSVVVRGETGLVYRAWDHALARPVAIKEYLPAALARRDANGEAQPAEPDFAKLFERGRYAFVDEARTLGRCDHPSLVRVLDLLEAHGTAYRVMPWYCGRLLLDVRHKMAGPLSEAALRLLLDNLLGALEDYQRVGGVHRGVSPSQVLLLDDGRALLLGPGAASRALQSGLVDPPARPPNPGFAPPEQAGPSHRQAQGPWTDFHALAALARFCISGMPPPVGLGPCEPLSETVERLFVDRPTVRYDIELLRALDAALSPDIAKRPQTAAQYRERLLRAQPQRPASPAPSVDPADRFDTVGAGDTVGAMHAANGIDAAMADRIPRVVDSIPEPFATALRSDVYAMPLLSALPADRSDPPAAPAPPPQRGHRALWASLTLAALAAVGVGAWQLQAPPFRLTVAALLQPPGTAQPAPVTETEAPAALPPMLVAAVLERAPPAEPTPPPAAERMQPRPPIAQAQPDPPAPNPAPAAPAAPAAKRPAVDNAAGPGVSSPRQDCGARTEFSLYRCMQQQCGLAKWQRHPQCLRLESTDSVD